MLVVKASVKEVDVDVDVDGDVDVDVDVDFEVDIDLDADVSSNYLIRAKPIKAKDRSRSAADGDVDVLFTSARERWRSTTKRKGDKSRHPPQIELTFAELQASVRAPRGSKSASNRGRNSETIVELSSEKILECQVCPLA